jgi:methanogenic corrinoid protein MtbC1
MTPQTITDESWTESDATCLIHGMARASRRDAPTRGQAGDATSGTPGAESQRRDVLTRTVQDEVIPRLLMARRAQTLASRAGFTLAKPAHVENLAALAMHGTQGETEAYVEALQDRGEATEAIFLELLAPAARRLGVMWEDDTADFAEVTIGLMRLGNVLRLLGRAFSGDTLALPGAPSALLVQSAPSALLVQMPGEQHGFGLAMVAQFFRRAGWRVREAPMVTRDALLALVGVEYFAVLGISVSCDDRLDALAADIAAIRRHARNPSLGVLVGGPPFVAHPGLAALVGADATAADGRQAVLQAQSLVARLARS